MKDYEYEIKHSEYSYFLHKRYLPVIHSYKAGIFYSSKDSYLPSNTEQLAISFFFFFFLIFFLYHNLQFLFFLKKVTIQKTIT